MTAPPVSVKRNLFKVLIPVVVILGLVIAGLSLIKSRIGAQSPTIPQEVAVGSVLPDFTMDTFQGKPVQASQLTSKITLINFWATWCSACMTEMPSIVKLRGAYHDRGFEVAAVNVDENPETVLPPTLKRLAITFPIFLDHNGHLSELFDVHAIPLTVIMDKNRKVLMMESGEEDWDGPEFRAKLEKWLGV